MSSLDQDVHQKLADGVIEPVKVVRSALQNAASVSGLMLTTEAVVADKPKEEKALAGRGGHPTAAAWAATSEIQKSLTNARERRTS